MRYAKAALCFAPLFLCAANPAHAASNMTCATAMSLVTNNPGIESASIMSVVTMQWEKMDQATVSSNHAAITQQMMNNPGYTQMFETQCEENPGQPLTAAAAQVYRQARVRLDGY
jgi:hypothetical protein